MEEVKQVNVNIPKKAIVINKYAENGGWTYCLGVIGAFIYYLQTTSGFWEGLLGFLKALVWPAYFVYHIFKFLGV